MESWERIKFIMDREGMNKNSFSEAIGLSSNVTITRILNERRTASPTTCKKIHERFPQYNYEWIFKGEGEMINSNPESIAKATLETSHKEGVPYYENIDVTGGIIPSFSDYKEIPTFFIDYKHFNDCTAYLPVVGDSMYPKYASGEIVAIKQVFNRDIILWGETYLVIGNENTDNLRTIKLLHPHEDSGKIILRASNPNYRGDTIINKSDIVALYIVKGKITRNQL